MFNSTSAVFMSQEYSLEHDLSLKQNSVCDAERRLNKKLAFYKSVKDSFALQRNPTCVWAISNSAGGRLKWGPVLINWALREADMASWPLATTTEHANSAQLKTKTLSSGCLLFPSVIWSLKMHFMLCALALSTMLIVTRIPSKQRLFVDDPRYSIVVTFEGSLSTLGTFSASDF